MALKFEVDTGGTLVTGLVMYYKLDDAANGTRTNKVTPGTDDLTDVNSSVGSVAGKKGNAADFSTASTQRLKHIDDAVNSLGQSWSIACWFKPTASTPANAGLVSKDDAATDTGAEYQLYTGANTNGGDPYIQKRHAGGWSSATSTFGAFTAGTWYFIVAYYDGTNLGISVNNGAFNTAASTSAMVDSTADFFVGYSGARNNTGCLGAVDEVGVWKKVLTATEITDLYNGGSGNTLNDVVVGAANMAMMGVGG